MTTLNTTPATKLRQLTTACSIQFTWWGTKKALTKEQRHTASSPFHADAKQILAFKSIVDKNNPALKALNTIRYKITQFWRSMTLPYTHEGIRLLPKRDVETFNTQMKSFKQDFDEAVSRFASEYHTIQHNARAALQELYNQDDYPPTINDKFSLEWDFPPIEPPTYLEQLSPDVYKKEQEKIQTQFTQAIAAAEQAFATQLSEMIAHLTDKLTPSLDGTKKIFRDSAITNLKTFFNRFHNLNITDNDTLTDLVKQAQQLLTGIDPKDLRTLPALQNEVSTGMQQISQKLATLIINRPRRAITILQKENKA